MIRKYLAKELKSLIRTKRLKIPDIAEETELEIPVLKKLINHQEASIYTCEKIASFITDDVGKQLHSMLLRESLNIIIQNDPILTEVEKTLISDLIDVVYNRRII